MLRRANRAVPFNQAADRRSTKRQQHFGLCLAITAPFYLVGLLIFTSPSFALEPGEAVPDFVLKTTEDLSIKLSDFHGDIVALIFWSAACPITKSYERRIEELFNRFALEGVHFLYIDANSGEALKKIVQTARDRKIAYPILVDTDQSVARLLGATTTPEVFVVDPEGHLAYRGAIDSETWARRKLDQPYLRNALEALLKGGTPPKVKTDPYGKEIKGLMVEAKSAWWKFW